MGNYGVITGASAQVNLVNGTTQLALASIADNEGVSIAANQFTVDGIGNYLATIRLYPNSIGAGYVPTIQIWNATTAALVGSRPMPVPVSYSGFYGLTVQIPFNVSNAAHNFQIRIEVPGQVRYPNICTLAVEGGTIMQAIIASTAANADGGLYGSGADGDVAVAAPLTLVRDMHYNNLSVGAGQAVATAGFRIFVRGTLTLAAGSSITGNGAAGATSAAGGGAGAAAVGQTIGAGFIGGAGQVAGGAAGTNATTTGGGAGGAGGAGNAGGNAGGAGGTATAPTAAQGGPTAANAVLSGPNATQAALAGTAVATLVQGGGGGGGGGGSGAVEGGGGGGGGGVVIVAARNIVGTGTIEANGGAGGDGAAAADAGGGGGGGGGFVVTASNANLPATVTVQALGGAGGAGGAGGGVAGTDGAAGNTVHVKLGS